MLRLLLPALIPSWRFFDIIAPSPRIEFALLDRKDDPEPNWRAFRPHPAHLPVTALIGRLFWNSRWNESLYMITCAERLLEHPSRFREIEILRRIAAAVDRGEIELAGAQSCFLRFRILVLERRATRISRRVAFTSTAAELALSP